jgi:DNA-binding transcriptional regulator YbjK
MKCETLFQIMASSLTSDTLVKCSKKCKVPVPTCLKGEADLYQWAHELCHQDSLFTRHMQRYLDRKHAMAMTRVSASDPERLQQLIEHIMMQAETTLPKDIAGIIWAISSDARAEIRPLEETLINGLHILGHALLLKHLRGDAVFTAVAESPPTASDTPLQHVVTQLSTERRTLQAALTQQQQANARMQEQLETLQRRYQTVQRQVHNNQVTTVSQSAARRDLKKLQHHVNKLTAVVSDQEDTIQQLHGLIRSYEARLKAQNRPPHEAPETLTSASQPSQDLQGKTVALIGGLGRMAPHYLQTIETLGGCCLYHDGNLHQGEKKLADMVKQADIVFCMVNRNSHSAASCTKKLCKAFQKPCYFLPSSGISGVRDKLLELTTQQGSAL